MIGGVMSSISQGSGDVQWIDSNIQGINELKREIDKSEDIAFNKFVEKITKKFKLELNIVLWHFGHFLVNTTRVINLMIY